MNKTYIKKRNSIFIRKKSIIFILINAAVFFLCAACGKSAGPGYTPRQIAETVIAAQEYTPTLYPLYPGDDNYLVYLSDVYRVEPEPAADGAVYYAGGIEACEFAVFSHTGPDEAKRTEELLSEYKERRAAIFTGYAPDQAAMVKSGAVVRQGSFVALLICENTENAERVFMSCFGANPPPLPDAGSLARIASVSTAAVEITTVTSANTMAETTPPTAQTQHGTDGSVTDVSANGAPDADPAELPSTTVASAPTVIPADKASSTAAISETAVNTSERAAAAVTTQVVRETASTAAVEETTADTATATVQATSTAGVSDIGPSAVTDTPEADSSSEAGTQPADAQDSIKSTAVAAPSETPSADPPDADASAASDDSDNHADISAASDDSYNHAAVLSAWNSGDASGLSDKNRAVYDACVSVINAVIKNGMTEYEKELAIHDWIIKWAEYDPEALSNAPDAKPDPDNDNPYGLLINKKSICRGYTLTFKLFMDMLGIECIVVDGAAHEGVDVHAWNMVTLDGDWYCVDVTWDDPVGSSGNVNKYLFHRFFNCTSQFLRDFDHQWDEDSIPEATATDYAWNPR